MPEFLTPKEKFIPAALTAATFLMVAALVPATDLPAIGNAIRFLADASAIYRQMIQHRAK